MQFQYKNREIRKYFKKTKDKYKKFKIEKKMIMV